MISFLQKILKFFVNIVFLLQIALSVMVFIITVYWFMSLLGWDYFDFAKPIADFAAGMVRIFLPRNAWGPGITGFELSLLYFDIAALLLVYLGDKLKISIYDAMKRLDISQDKQNLREEYRFNDQLRKEYENTLRDMKNVAVLVEFGLKLAYADMYFAENLAEKLHEREEYVLDAFYKEISKDFRCERKGNKIFVVDEFANADKLLLRIDEAAEKLRVILEAQQWLLDKFVSVEGYGKLTKDVYISLTGLLNLQLTNKMACYSNFVVRYELEQERFYNPVLFGKYEQDVWVLVNKS
jgi:hypothetical protein